MVGADETGVQIPQDDNAVEKAIRNITVKQKVLGPFKLQHGAFDFAMLRFLSRYYF